METAKLSAILNVLIRYDGAPKFGDHTVAHIDAQQAREAAFGPVKAEANGFAVHRASIEEFAAQKQITYQWAASSKRCGPTPSCRRLLRRYD